MSKSMHAFLSNLASRQIERQTNRQTRAKTCTSSFVGGKKTTPNNALWRMSVQCYACSQNCQLLHLLQDFCDLLIILWSFAVASTRNTRISFSIVKTPPESFLSTSYGGSGFPGRTTWFSLAAATGQDWTLSLTVPTTVYHPSTACP